MSESEMNLPHCVNLALERIKRQDAVQEIWLIGSQANNTAKPSSDWDLLVLANAETVFRPKQNPEVDVIWCNPSNSCLAEGSTEQLIFPFSDFQWCQDVNEAIYTGRKFTDYEPNTAFDMSEPLQVRTQQKAFRLWFRK